MTVGDGVTAALFNGVAHGVSQIQELPLSQIPFVPLHDAGLVGDTTGDDSCRIGGEDAVFKEGKEALVTQNAGFDGLRRAAGKGICGQGGQAIRVAQYGGGLQKGARQIFPCGEIDGGFAAHGGIHRGQQRGGQLYAADSPQVYGGGKARNIAGHSAAQGGHTVGAGETLLRQKFQNRGEGF